MLEKLVEIVNGVWVRPSHVSAVVLMANDNVMANDGTRVEVRVYSTGAGWSWWFKNDSEALELVTKIANKLNQAEPLDAA